MIAHRTLSIALAMMAGIVADVASAQQCWDKRIQLWVPCTHLEKIDPLLPGKECWHADYQAFDTCAIESFHSKTQREKCQEIGKRLDWGSGKCL